MAASLSRLSRALPSQDGNRVDSPGGANVGIQQALLQGLPVLFSALQLAPEALLLHPQCLQLRHSLQGQQLS